MIQSEQKGIHFLHFPSLLKFKELTHFVTTRDGGVSTGTFGSLNLGDGGDNPEQITLNRKILASAIGMKEDKVFYCHQTHSDHIRIIDSNFLHTENNKQKELLSSVDAMISNLPGICLIIRTADCVPVLLYDAQKKVIAAAHAGWKGTVSQIARKTLNVMQNQFNSNPSDVFAAIGPSISPDIYEVGPEVADHFREAFSFSDQLLRNHGEGKYLLNLWEANKLQLTNAGIPDSNIEIANKCTYSNSDLFFSARRDGYHSGRIGTGIYLSC